MIIKTETHLFTQQAPHRKKATTLPAIPCCTYSHYGHVRFTCDPTRPAHVACASARLNSLSRPSEDPSNRRQTLLPESDVLYKEGDFVEVGTVKGAFGIVGELRIDISTDNPKQRFRKGAKLYLQPPKPTGLLVQTLPKEQPLYQVVVQSSKVRILPKGQQMWLLKSGEVADRNTAEQLTGYRVLIPLSQREQLKDPDEFWVQDLVGCSVSLQEAPGQRIGVVVDIVSGTGTYDTMVVQLNLTHQDITSSTTRRCMVPFVKVMCPEVDLQRRAIVISPPEGLLDLVSKKPMGKKLKPEQQEAMLAELAAGQQPSLGRKRSAASTTTSESSSNSSRNGPMAASQQNSLAASIGSSSSSSEGPTSQSLFTASQQADSALEEDDDPEFDDDEEEEEGEEEEVVEEQEGGSRGKLDSERWRLRRRLGASFAARGRGRPGVRRLRGRRGLSRGSSEEADSDAE
ncbi:hypothetical protein DUNSADRAFT_10174 [Dunaliella salina]|uniref:Uncharacterized protein n=1 Tax=Dunaliella salina TaxID=3046 RepID=A0ABQ7GFZ0_DUNSA|nr:hypothetical protein DUNSADRAFT_10174 [Dunaliella salina]|eukprot:KAF5833523.1 hypothetical protein DUNSADRAFT_10174 [Dunaliella salina]